VESRTSAPAYLTPTDPAHPRFGTAGMTVGIRFSPDSPLPFVTALFPDGNSEKISLRDITTGPRQKKPWRLISIFDASALRRQNQT